MKRIALILPSLDAGGAERVMSILANNFQKQPDTQIHFILLVGGEIFYEISENVRIHKPSFNYKEHSRLVYTQKIFQFLRKKLKGIKPNILLSFEGRYNSFVLAACWGLNIRTFISERSRPGISYGKLLDMINKIVYKRATGIIAQTHCAKDHLFRITKHANIAVIGNPIMQHNFSDVNRQFVVLNVGRFIKSKHQDLLVDYFKEIDRQDWRIWFVGTGNQIAQVKEKAKRLDLKDTVIFWDNQPKLDYFYSQASIFAFTSTSEGFPNVLGEAMAAGCACISFDCTAGPSDLIDHGKNGFLIKEGDHKTYIAKLDQLMNDENLRTSFGKEAKKKMRLYDEQVIADLFFNFITS